MSPWATSLCRLRVIQGNMALGEDRRGSIFPLVISGKPNEELRP